MKRSAPNTGRLGTRACKEDDPESSMQIEAQLENGFVLPRARVDEPIPNSSCVGLLILNTFLQ